MIQEDWIGLFQSPHLSQIPSQGWIQGCNWMWQVSLRISWLTQGLPTLSWPPVPNIFLPNQYHFGWYQKNNYKKIHPCSSLLVGWKIFFLQFLVVAKCPTSFLGRDLSLPSKSCSYWCPDRGFFKTLSWGQGKSHEQRSLVGYSPWGHKESDTTEQFSLHFLHSPTFTTIHDHWKNHSPDRQTFVGKVKSLVSIYYLGWL